MISEILILVGCLCLSAFFAMSETAITTVSRMKVHRMVEQGVRNAKVLHRLRDEPGKFLSTVLIGNNFVNITASVLATSLSINLLHSLGWGGVGTALGFATGIMTFLVLVFGEIMPKTLAIQNAERVALSAAPFIYVISFILYPLIIVLTAVSQLFLMLFGYKVPKKGPFVTEEDIRILLTLGEKEGVIEERERKMIANIFDLGDTMVREVMTPKPDILAADIDGGIDKVVAVITESGHSRIPLYEGNLDNMLGIVCAKDILSITADQQGEGLRSLLRPVIFVPETKKLDDLMREMQSSRTHLAVVVDEYGGMAGIVTFEDLLEEVVGEIRDEFDREEKRIEKVDELSYLVDARLTVAEVNEALKLDIPAGDYDTIGGFVLEKLGKVPTVGDVVHYQNLIMHVEKVAKRRITRIQLFRQKENPEGFVGG